MLTKLLKTVFRSVDRIAIYTKANHVSGGGNWVEERMRWRLRVSKGGYM